MKFRAVRKKRKPAKKLVSIVHIFLKIMKIYKEAAVTINTYKKLTRVD